jgi:hypothetical protein
LKFTFSRSIPFRENPGCYTHPPLPARKKNDDGTHWRVVTTAARQGGDADACGRRPRAVHVRGFASAPPLPACGLAEESRPRWQPRRGSRVPAGGLAGGAASVAVSLASSLCIGCRIRCCICHQVSCCICHRVRCSICCWVTMASAGPCYICRVPVHRWSGGSSHKLRWPDDRGCAQWRTIRRRGHLHCYLFSTHDLLHCCFFSSEVNI